MSWGPGDRKGKMKREKEREHTCQETSSFISLKLTISFLALPFPFILMNVSAVALLESLL